MGRHFSAEDFFWKVIDEILENLLLFWRFGSFDNYPQKNSKISSKKMKKSCFGSAIFLSKCSSLDLQWGQMGRGFPADDFFCQKSSLLRRSVRGHYVTLHLIFVKIKTAAILIFNRKHHAN